MLKLGNLYEHHAPFIVSSQCNIGLYVIVLKPDDYRGMYIAERLIVQMSRLFIIYQI